MMQRLNISTTMTFSRMQLLEKLQVNLSKHRKIVEEAIDGYIQKAKEALEQKLEQIRKRNVVSLMFSLAPPKDMSKAYETMIQMLTMSKDEVITLDASTFRQLVLDEWDWSDQFWASNSPYLGGVEAK